ncbi:disulfide bond formation protein B [Legionella jordanis]|uniref:Transmembrane protein n=1 Tax=Legionella jordanis TaxID=456 RepID=A0A0W0VBB6_9GAMM|nr:disulfide bond formation protein B [Legionella jordanis]KTD17419.1 transmembrane protein [Legionella jordanis]RMX01816.1 disulfide bond formation protein B [Legionella jordanis]RMX15480.1 disulfide bond formation protein B [Legionella jordanis]VEH11559.1 inner (transmembrane) protein [Legionella jordanis]HAT8714634.1 disulfide bond formation protein B [Legionella jordanis]
MITQNQLHRFGNILGLAICCAVLLVAFYQQLIDHSLPCPLCLLQRACFIAVGLCLCMNLMSGIRVSFYGLMILSSLLGLGIALRQIFIHISPGDLGYGSPLLGLYLYTWSAIGFAIIIGLLSIGLMFDRAFYEPSTRPKWPSYVLMSFFLLLILANGLSTFLECGPFICKDNPVHYYLFDNLG